MERRYFKKEERIILFIISIAISGLVFLVGGMLNAILNNFYINNKPIDKLGLIIAPIVEEGFKILVIIL